jgi:hypothetical protein
LLTVVPAINGEPQSVTSPAGFEILFGGIVCIIWNNPYTDVTESIKIIIAIAKRLGFNLLGTFCCSDQLRIHSDLHVASLPQITGLDSRARFL